MATQDDQPRPDLDAALDAVVPTLTALSDEAATASLRRTRLALADRGSVSGWRGWRWAVPAVALVTAAIAAFLWRPAALIDVPRVGVVFAPPGATLHPLPAQPPPIAVVAPASPANPPTRVARVARVQATSIGPRVEASKPDPLIALVGAVQAIPEDAWRAGVARAETPVAVPEIDIAPIDTPPVGDVPVDPIAPGEP